MYSRTPVECTTEAMNIKDILANVKTEFKEKSIPTLYCLIDSLLEDFEFHCDRVCIVLGILTRVVLHSLFLA